MHQYSVYNFKCFIKCVNDKFQYSLNLKYFNFYATVVVTSTQIVGLFRRVFSDVIAVAALFVYQANTVYPVQYLYVTLPESRTALRIHIHSFVLF